MNDRAERDYAARVGLAKRHLPAAMADVKQRLRFDGEVHTRLEDTGEYSLLASGLWELTVRVRGPEYLPRFQHDITFRTASNSSLKVELARVKAGEGSLLWYGFGMPDSDAIQYPTIIDLDAFREALERNLIKEVTRKPNGDGTAFSAYDIRHFGRTGLPIVVSTAHMFIPSVYGELERQEKAEWLEQMKKKQRDEPEQLGLF